MSSVLSTVGAFALADLVLLVTALVPRSAARRTAAARRFAARLGLDVDPGLRLEIERRVDLQRRVSAIAGAGGVAVLLVVLSVAADGTWTAASSMTLVALTWTAAGLAAAIAAVVQRGGRRAGARVARSRALDLDDYVPPRERVLARAAAVVGLAAASGAAVLVGPSVVLVVQLGCVVLAIVLFEVGGRSVVRRAQPAGSVIELEWDDAFRSENLRALAQAPLLTGLYSVLAAAMLVGSTTALGVGACCAGAALVAAIVTSSARRRRYALVRLWTSVETRP